MDRLADHRNLWMLCRTSLDWSTVSLLAWVPQTCTLFDKERCLLGAYHCFDLPLPELLSWRLGSCRAVAGSSSCSKCNPSFWGLQTQIAIVLAAKRELTSQHVWEFSRRSQSRHSASSKKWLGGNRRDHLSTGCGSTQDIALWLTDACTLEAYTLNFSFWWPPVVFLFRKVPGELNTKSNGSCWAVLCECQQTSWEWSIRKSWVPKEQRLRRLS